MTTDAARPAGPIPDDDPALDPALRKLLSRIRLHRDPAFHFESYGPIPFQALATPLARTTVVLATTAGFHVKGDAPFPVDERPDDDTSWRLVPQDTPVSDLDLHGAAVDRKYVADDPEVALPRAALARLAEDGVVGAPAARHAVFRAGLLRPLPGLRESVGELLPTLREDGVGAAVILSTCSLCAQTAAVIGRELESHGIPTVGISLLPELTALNGAPRTLAPKFPFGAPAGDPRHGALHRAVLREALERIERETAPGAIQPSRYAWRRPPDRPPDA